jgi:hypothetical protein
MPRVLKDPGKIQGPIQAPSGDPAGQDRWTGRKRCPDPCLSRAQWSTRATTNLGQPYTIEHYVVCTGVLISA